MSSSSLSSPTTASENHTKTRSEEDVAKVLPALLNVGAVQRMLHQRAEAAASYEEALRLAKKGTPAGDAAEAAALHEVAALAEEDPQTFGDPIPAYARALEARRKAHGGGKDAAHHAVADTLFCLGRARLAAQDDRGALAAFVEVLAIRKATLGPRHPSVATVLTRLAQIHSKLREFDVAVDMFDDALAIRREVFGVGHPALGQGAAAAAEAYVKLRDYEHAAARYKTAHLAYRLGGADAATCHAAFLKYHFCALLAMG
eukprot:CAMPEP_0118910268 /NCGR_PEP_ID=MMETSP1166-20130328/12486_1 /TAXON_ID=1104430 /ORGANISM="Chrysoreinhardia sp, Strain CCMP3193" /LENGTH=258 /DNA_ID=CAMNT_0006849727 /DNA_START=53 /DNA_END=826 /DNA_ORIENTATION=+